MHQGQKHGPCGASGKKKTEVKEQQEDAGNVCICVSRELPPGRRKREQESQRDAEISRIQESPEYPQKDVGRQDAQNTIGNLQDGEGAGREAQCMTGYVEEITNDVVKEMIRVYQRRVKSV